MEGRVARGKAWAHTPQDCFATVVRAEAELAKTLVAALRRNGPTVIDALVDPAGYPMIMDLSRGEADVSPCPRGSS